MRSKRLETLTGTEGGLEGAEMGAGGLKSCGANDGAEPVFFACIETRAPIPYENDTILYHPDPDLFGISHSNGMLFRNATSPYAAIWS